MIFINPDYEINEEDCIFIEPANLNNLIPEEYYENHFNFYLQLTGQFYRNKGIPNSYERKTPLNPQKAKVFRYDNFDLIEKTMTKKPKKEETLLQETDKISNSFEETFSEQKVLSD